MKIRRARIDGGVSPCAATPENIGKKRCCHIADMASRATLSVLTAIALTACSVNGSTVSTETSPIESSAPDGTSISETTPTESREEIASSISGGSSETTEEIVYIYGGRYYQEGDPAIEGKSVEAMTLSDAQNAGYTDGATMTEDEKCAYDYNMAWDMIAQGYSDEQIRNELLTRGYENNEEAANFLIQWVRDDYASGNRAYESNGTYTPSIAGSSSGSENSGSGSSGSGSSGSGSSGSGSSGSGSSGSGNSGNSGSGSGNSGGSTQPTTPTETQAPAPTETQPDWQSGFEDVYGPQPTPTQPAPTEPAPTETQAPTPTPVPATPTPKPAPTISYYELEGSGFDADGNTVTFSCTGDSKSSVKNQYTTWLGNHGYDGGSYNVYAVYSDGSRRYA